MTTVIKALLIIAYASLFGEAFIRFMDPQAIMPRYVQASDDGIRMNIPNSVYRQVTRTGNIEVRINDQGIRNDRRISEIKAPGVCRIVLLGDSFMLGYEVDLENSLAYLLEQKLNSNDVSAESVNLAVSGFGTAEHLIALQSRGAQFNPDLVILEWHTTDTDDNKRSNLYKVEDQNLKQINASYLPAIEFRNRLMQIPGYEWLINHGQLYNALREIVSKFIKTTSVDLLRLSNSLKPDNLDSTALETSSEPTSYADNLDELLIMEVNKVSHDMGAPMILLDIPKNRRSKSLVESSFDLLDMDLLTNVESFSLQPDFDRIAKSGIELYTIKGHAHWNEKGNEVAASLLSEFITEGGYCK